MNANNQNHRAILKSLAHEAMFERGLLPDFSAEALAELGRLEALDATIPNASRGVVDALGHQHVDDVHRERS